MTIRGDQLRSQQVAGKSFVATDLYGPRLKAHEALLLLVLAIATAEGCSVYKTDTSQAFLYGSMDNDVVYIRAPDWRPDSARAHTLRSLSTASQEQDEHLWYPAGCPQMAQTHLGVDGGEWLTRS